MCSAFIRIMSIERNRIVFDIDPWFANAIKWTVSEFAAYFAYVLLIKKAHDFICFYPVSCHHHSMFAIRWFFTFVNIDRNVEKSPYESVAAN